MTGQLILVTLILMVSLVTFFTADSPPQTLLSERSEAAAAALTEAAVLVDELAADVESRQSEIRQLVEEQRENAELADLSTEQVEAIVEKIGSEAQQANRWNLRNSIIVSGLSLIMGFLLNQFLGPRLRRGTHQSLDDISSEEVDSGHQSFVESTTHDLTHNVNAVCECGYALGRTGLQEGFCGGCGEPYDLAESLTLEVPESGLT